MNAERIKNVYENMPKGIKRVFAPIFISAMLGNRSYKEMHESLLRFDDLSARKQDAIQLELTKKQCLYAYQHTTYYKELFDSVGFNPEDMTSLSDLSAVPLTDKYIAQAQGGRMYSDEDIDCYEAHTSGSTGKVFRVLLDKKSIYRERAVVCHYMEKFGYDPKHTRTLALWGHNKDQDYYYSPLKNEIVVSPFRLFKTSDFENVWKVINDYRPEVIAGYPSAINVFCDLIRKLDKKLHLKFVLFYGETSNECDFQHVHDVLGCECITYYGHTERCAFLEKYEDGYRINKLYGYTELLPTEKEKVFKIVSTGFLSNKMPLIRYATDDYVVIDSRGYMEVKGHTYSEARVIAKNGSKIYKGTISPHTAPFEKVRLYQYVQDKPGHVFLDAVMDEPFSDEDLRELRMYFDRKCEGLLDVDIREVGKLLANSRGKYDWLIDNIDYSAYPELRKNE